MGLPRGGFGQGRAKRLLPHGAPAILESFGRHEGPAPGGDVLAGIEFGQAVKKALAMDPERGQLTDPGDQLAADPHLHARSIAAEALREAAIRLTRSASWATR
jgi:hypothetical protein